MEEEHEGGEREENEGFKGGTQREKKQTYMRPQLGIVSRNKYEWFL